MTEDKSPRLGNQEDSHREPRLGGDAYIAQILEALQAEDESIRQQAVALLETIGSNQVLEIVLDAITDRSKLVQRRAIRALGKFPGMRSLETLEEIILDGIRDYDIRCEACYAVIEHGEAARELLYSAWQELQSRSERSSFSPSISNLLRYGLARLRDQRVIPDLLRELRERGSPYSGPARSLAAFGAPMALLLLEASEQAESIVRYQLRDIMEQCSEWYSSRFLKIEMRGYRDAITFALGEFDDSALVPTFSEHLLREDTDALRDQHLARTLGRMNDRRAVPALLAVLHRPRFMAMMWAAEALYGIEGAVTPEVEVQIMDVLQAWLDQYNMFQRYEDFANTIYIIRFLGQIRSDQAVPLLAGKLGDTHENLYQFERGYQLVRIGDMAADMLEQIGSPSALAMLAEYQGGLYRSMEGEPE